MTTLAPRWLKIYTEWASWCLKHRLKTTLAAVAFFIGSFALVPLLPTGFIPSMDRAIMVISLQLPPGASLQRTDDVTRKAEEIITKTPGVKDCATIVGYNMLSGVSNTYSTFFFINLEEWAKRKKPEEQYNAIKDHINRGLRGISGAIGFAFPPPAIPGIGTR